MDVHVKLLKLALLGGPASVTEYVPSGTDVQVWVLGAEVLAAFTASFKVKLAGGWLQFPTMFEVKLKF